MNTLRDAVNAQQQQIQMLRDEVARRDAAMQRMQDQLNSLQQSTTSTRQAAEACCTANGDALASLRTNFGTVQASETATANSLLANEKRISALESPLSIKYKGITITPGGFIAAQLNWRQHNQNLDNFGNFGAIPFAGSSNGHLPEFRITGRYSRISLLAQGKTKSFDVKAYYEMDFEGAAQTANEVQTNSFQPRIREAWLNVDAPHGVSVAGGQTWSLITANRTGVGVQGLMLPSHISASLTVGFHYTRGATFRVSKKWDLANKSKVYWAFAVENPETTSSGAIPAGLTIWGTQGAVAVSLGGGGNCGNGSVAGLAPCSTFASNLSIDAAPDVITKVALEPGWGHFELGLIGRFFRDRVGPTVAGTGSNNAGSNHTTPGGGVSLNGLLPVVPKKVDIVIATLGGRGIGRYGTTGIPDATFRPDGRLEPLLAYTGYLGVETHPSPKLDFNVYVGDEYTKRTTYYTVAPPLPLLPTGLGYGLIGQDLRACNMEIPTAGFGCSPSNKNVYQISPGFWYRFYRGPAGTLQFGAFYSYYHRTTWAGRQDATGAAPKALQASQNEILTSFRWYFP